jgi:RNA polymerase-binding transcription factor DksA
MPTELLRIDLPHFERKLRARAGVLRQEIREALLRSDSEPYVQLAGLVHDAADEAIADLLVDVNLSEITRDVEECRDIEGALTRIRTRAYGVCVSCREPIALDRLEAYPTAKRCLACQQLHDRRFATPPAPTL